MNTVHLIGAEQVGNAASTIRHAAEEMSRLPGNLDYTLLQFLQRFETLVERIEQAAEKIAKADR